MKITTNNQPRDLVSFHDLPENVQSDFDYIEADAHHDLRLFKYRGAWHDVNEYVQIIARRDTYNGWAMQVDADSPLLKWDGIQSDTYFSGTVIKYGDDCETVILGRYCD